MIFKVGDEVVCNREGMEKFSNMLGIIIDYNYTYSVWEVKIYNDPFTHTTPQLPWCFVEKEMRKISKLERAMR